MARGVPRGHGDKVQVGRVRGGKVDPAAESDLRPGRPRGAAHDVMDVMYVLCLEMTGISLARSVWLFGINISLRVIVSI